MLSEKVKKYGYSLFLFSLLTVGLIIGSLQIFDIKLPNQASFLDALDMKKTKTDTGVETEIVEENSEKVINYQERIFDWYYDDRCCSAHVCST